MIVVDVNVIAYFFIQGDKTALARKVFKIEPRWAMPFLWQHEFLNVLATFARRGGADTEAVTRIWLAANDLFQAAAHEPHMPLALELSITNGISAYDAQYIALANQLDTQCVTEDKQLIRLFPKTALSMQTFCDERSSGVTFKKTK